MTNLDSNQNELASRQLNGFVMVDAGPGTGKTTTLVERYVNILRTQKKSNGDPIDPSNILMLTFTNSAALEMEKRIRKRLYEIGGELAKYAPLVEAKTFDSFCNQLVRDSSDRVMDVFDIDIKMMRSSEIVGDEKDNRILFDELVRDFVISEENQNDYNTYSDMGVNDASSLRTLIGKLISFGLVPLGDGTWFGVNVSKVLFGDNEGNRSEDVLELSGYLHKIYRRYICKCLEKGAMTFGLIALVALMMLYSDPEVRERYSYDYLMIDEFQDTSTLQLLITLMIMKSPNLCVIGDWKQGIYGFRDADVDNILCFKKKVVEAYQFINNNGTRINFELPECIQKVDFDKNYRSSQKILDASFKSLELKAFEGEKIQEKYLENIVELTAQRSEIGDSTHVRLLKTDNCTEPELVTSCVLEYLDSKNYVIRSKDSSGTIQSRAVDLSDISVLCRTGKQCTRIFDALSWSNVPAYIYGDVEVMSSTVEGEIASTWASIICGDMRSEKFRVIMELEKIDQSTINSVCSREYLKSRPYQIVKLYNEFRSYWYNPAGMMTKIFDHYGIHNDYSESIIAMVASKYGNSLATFPDLADLLYLDRNYLKTKYEIDPSNDEGAVKIMTMHKSKGLEFNAVIIPYLDDYLKKPVSNYRYPEEEDDDYIRTFNYVDGQGITFVEKATSENRANKSSIYDLEFDEDRRLLFVAMSRAKQYITMTYRGITNNGSNSFRKGLEIYLDGEEKQYGEVRYEKKKKEDPLSERPTVEYNPKRLRKITPHDIMQLTASSPENGSRGKEHGTKVHEDAELMFYGCKTQSGIITDVERNNIKKILERMPDSSRYSEVPCRYRVEGTDIILSGVMDLLYVTDDSIEIHDYKTDKVENDTGVSKSHEEYCLQLSIYSQAVKDYYHKEHVECYIDYISDSLMDLKCIPLKSVEDIVTRCLKKDMRKNKEVGKMTNKQDGIEEKDEGLQWRYDAEKQTLFIRGSGPMRTFKRVNSYQKTISFTNPPWFNLSNSIKEILIEGDVTSVGDGAFRQINSLETVVLSEKVESIGLCAFQGCTNLKSIIIPKTMKSIGHNAFDGCTALKEITVPANVNTTDIGVKASYSSSEWDSF